VWDLICLQVLKLKYKVCSKTLVHSIRRHSRRSTSSKSTLLWTSKPQQGRSCECCCWCAQVESFSAVVIQRSSNMPIPAVV
jgi:hypothetical protein